MHELPVTESILEIALRHAEAAQASRVKSVFLVVGQLSSIVDDSVQFYWELIGQGTIAEGAQLHFRRVATEFECLDCLQGYTPSEDELGCPLCGGANVRVVAGDEFFVEAIDIETEEVAPRMGTAGAES
ncbi:MAG: hydrogenase maturation nickel metallochaperone HypA [Anaerolineales bacterium]|nr:hydrogenase maturation nickel metallochaperone HypA [Anaerolineales bacterium]